MNPRSRALLLSTLLFAAAGVVLYRLAAASAATGSESVESTGAPGSALLVDAPLERFQVQLLDLAFEAVSKMPAMPHIKNRSRAQETVVAACLELDQEQRALRYAERIDNWRRGSAYADLAFHCAQRGDETNARKHAALATQVADALAQRIEAGFEDDSSVESPQDWQRDRIRTKVAQTYAWLGEMEQADTLEKGVVDSETGKVRSVRATLAAEESFDEQVQALDAIVASASFEEVRNTLGAYARLFERFYDQVERRELVHARIQAGWAKMPVQIRIELTAELVEAALGADDRTKALELLAAADALLDGASLTSEADVQSRAVLASLRHRAGDEEGARRQGAAAFATYAAQRAEIVDMYRAGVLRPLAEAQGSMQDEARALELYALAVEAGFENTSSRPRADDLCATCCSMAVRGVEPDAELWARLLEINATLGHPW